MGIGDLFVDSINNLRWRCVPKNEALCAVKIVNLVRTRQTFLLTAYDKLRSRSKKAKSLVQGSVALDWQMPKTRFHVWARMGSFIYIFGRSVFVRKMHEKRRYK